MSEKEGGGGGDRIRRGCVRRERMSDDMVPGALKTQN